MKKIFVILSAMLVAASCMRGDYMNEPDILGGHNVANNQEARKYMMYIADNLVTDMLDELDLALSISERGMTQSAHFAIDKPLTTPGATWKVKAEDSQLNGMTLYCEADETWVLSFNGNYVFGLEENNYPTRVTMTAVRCANETSLGWDVMLYGSRQEWNDEKKNQTRKSTYHCTFETPATGATLRYLNTRGVGAAGWNQVFGDLFMTVFKGNEQVDVCCLSFEGSPSQATFIRGL